MRYAVVEAKPWHAGQMLRAMRADHLAALTVLGVDVRREIRRALADSSYRRAWLVDGRVTAMGGIRGPLSASEGHLWLVVAEEAARHLAAFVREALHQLEEAIATRRRVVTTVPAADEISRRFATRMGFSPIGSSDGWLWMELRR